ncbi:LPXTG-motif cell wall anchor domain protein [Metarhizium robertsii ARSEF 23]|uniref:LPXTG-motif cell wall anchor domain protein n=1 Tax=Metarhizium robertsii (strain ARSEF 23 / ATCC MYA-3075) TaxID=655844 RepID=E9F0P6_METRA|nr:LPXTG-motif cell wall anchor domain protein [Metarhizium robertsii ARSEF 23]EFY98706.1 LPXTG-motif cell wall anchor domain protein [Metarhizium robertsii ARSEF 23]
MTESAVLTTAVASHQHQHQHQTSAKTNANASKHRATGTALSVGASLGTGTTQPANTAVARGSLYGRGGRCTRAGPGTGTSSPNAPGASMPSVQVPATALEDMDSTPTHNAHPTCRASTMAPSTATATSTSTRTTSSATSIPRSGPNEQNRPPSSPPRAAATVAAGGHHLDNVHADDSPPLTRHSHRQYNTSSKLPPPRPADSRRGPPAASSFPSQPHRPHHNNPGQVPHSLHGAPSSALPNPVPEQRPAPSIPDNIANTGAAADADANADAGREAESTTHHHPSSPFAVSPSATSPPRAAVHSRASSYHASPQPATSSSSDSPPAQPKRPASCPESGPDHADQTTSPSSLSPTGTTKPLSWRGPASRSSNGVSTSDGPPPSLNTQRLHGVEAAAQTTAQPQPLPETPRTKSTQGQRELLLLNRLSGSSSSDDNRYPSPQRPPVSYRPAHKRHSIQPATLTPGRVPPIRSFRSSDSRKSLTQDMNPTSRPHDLGELYATSPEEQSPHNFEGRHAQGGVSLNDGESGRQDDGGDVFLRIARDEQMRRLRGEENLDDAQSSVSGIRRSSHRRPLSTVVPSYHHQTSPPRQRRRLSDQQDRPRPLHLEDDQGSEISRTTTFRSLLREKAASVHPGEEIPRTRSGGANLRPSPLSARSTVGYDNSQEASLYARRRASITDSNSTVGRTPGYRPSGLIQARNHGSSPLARTIDLQNKTGTEAPHGLEGTESTASTTAPSTVWDELDDLKSRINRLELTGKLPSTSGAAVSRMSEERPATATTTVTTLSGSPKRQVNGQIAEVSSTTSSQREAHPILHEALVKSRPYLSLEVYQALQSAANDAMALSSMMGTPGQPGPISSAASVVGTGGPAVTDRQLRRKADSVCRSLTELCVALGEAVGPANIAGSASPPALAQHDGPATPTAPKSYSSLPTPRRVAEHGIPKSISSPRPLSKFEERRSSILNGTALPTPRATGSAPTTPIEGNSQRRSSLMISRTRRAGTEEPEVARSPTMLRSRRAGTEEPEEGRQTSFLRNRRGTVGDDGGEGRFRPPSRADTDVNMLRDPGREYPSDSPSIAPDSASQIPSALPRRRFLSTSVHSSRLAGSQGSSIASPRRYNDRQAGEQDFGDSVGESRVQRQGPPLSKGIIHSRASSLSTRRNRDSLISTNSGATIGPYR